MIAFIGDVHRAFDALARAVGALSGEVTAVVQVGDLGLRPEDLWPPAGRVLPLNRLLHYITGNHDHEPWYRGLTAPTEMGPNLVYVPRGVILDLDGRRVGFLGGGDSLVDRPQRREGIDWWPEERVSGEDVERFAGVGKVDVLVAHTPPALVYPLFGFRPDPSAVYVERVWEMLGRPVTVCGHLHRARALGSIRVLAPMEVLLL